MPNNNGLMLKLYLIGGSLNEELYEMDLDSGVTGCRIGWLTGTSKDLPDYHHASAPQDYT